MKDIIGTARVIARPNPFKEETLQCHVGAGMTLRQILGNPGNNYIINVNGNNIESEYWETTEVSADDLVLIYRMPRGGDGKDVLRFLAAIVVIVFAYWAAPYLGGFLGMSEAFWASALMFVGFVAVGLLLPPELPNQDNGQRKRLNSLTGTRNQFAPFAPLPNPYGKHRLFPPIAAIPWTEVIGEDQYLNMIYCIGLGDYYMGDWSHLKIGDTPILQYSDVDLTITDQPDRPDIFELQQNINFDQGGEPGDTNTRTTAADTEEISLDFVLPAGLIQTDRDDGDNHFVEIHFSIEWRISGSMDPWVFVNATNGDFGNSSRGRRQGRHGVNVQNMNDFPPPLTTSAGSLRVSSRNINWLMISARTRDPIRVGVRWKVEQAANTFDVRVTRQETKRPSLNPVNTSSNGWDQYAAQFRWTALRSIKTTPAILLPAQTATFAVMRIRASDQLTGVVDTFNLVPERKLRNWNKAMQIFENVPAWDGSAVGVTRDPAWAFLDILTGLGNARPIPPADEQAKIDLDQLADWATENATEGFFYDEVIDYSTSVFDALTRVSGVGRAALSNRDGKWTVILEDNATGPVQYFTPRNSWGFSSTKRLVDYPHAFKVRFNSEQDDYQETELIVYDDGFDALNATKFEVIELAGVTNPDHAWKIARYTMASIRLRPEIYSFNADVEHIVAQRGDHIRVTHDIPLWGTGFGRIKSISVNTVTLDTEMVLNGMTSYVMRVRLDDGTSVIEDLTSQSGKVTSHTFTPTIPAGIKVGDLAMVGELGTESQELVVIAIEPQQDLTARITCVDHNPAILTADDGMIPVYNPNITLPVDPTQLVPDQPYNINAQSPQTTFVTDGSSVIQPRMTVTWDLSSSATSRFPALTVDLRWREYDIVEDPNNTGTWKYIRKTVANQTAISVENVDFGKEYEIQMRSVSQYDVPSDWTTSILHTIGGATRLPTQADSLSAFPESGRVRLEIDITSNDISNASYLEVTYSTVNNRVTPTPIVEQFSIPANTNAQTDLTVFVPFQDRLIRYFWVRIVDIYGNASDYLPLSSTAGVPGFTSNVLSLLDSSDWSNPRTDPMGGWSLVDGTITNTTVSNTTRGPFGELPPVLRIDNDGVTADGNSMSEWAKSFEFDEDSSYILYTFFRGRASDPELAGSTYAPALPSRGIVVGFTEAADPNERMTNVAAMPVDQVDPRAFDFTALNERSGDSWYLLVHVINPAGTTGNSGLSGIYLPFTGEKVYDIATDSELAWKAGASDITLRLGLDGNANDDADAYVEFCRPNIYKMDGSEPSLQSVMRFDPSQSEVRNVYDPDVSFTEEVILTGQSDTDDVINRQKAAFIYQAVTQVTGWTDLATPIAVNTTGGVGNSGALEIDLSENPGGNRQLSVIHPAFYQGSAGSGLYNSGGKTPLTSYPILPVEQYRQVFLRFKVSSTPALVGTGVIKLVLMADVNNAPGNPFYIPFKPIEIDLAAQSTDEWISISGQQFINRISVPPTFDERFARLYVEIPDTYTAGELSIDNLSFGTQVPKSPETQLTPDPEIKGGADGFEFNSFSGSLATYVTGAGLNGTDVINFAGSSIQQEVYVAKRLGPVEFDLQAVQGDAIQLRYRMKKSVDETSGSYTSDYYARVYTYEGTGQNVRTYGASPGAGITFDETSVVGVWEEAVDMIELDQEFTHPVKPRYIQIQFSGPGNNNGAEHQLDFLDARIVGRVFQQQPATSAATVGLVPKSNSTEQTKYLKGDGTWDDPPGGSASNSFETHTVTDLDSGFTWAETGSAVADSAIDVLTLVSGLGIDIDVDAVSDAIRFRIDPADGLTYTGINRYDDFGVLTDINTATPPTTELVTGFVGIYDADNSDNLAFYGFNGTNELLMRNVMRGGNFTMEATNAVGTILPGFSFRPDNDTRFYHKDELRLLTQDAGNLWIISDDATLTPPTTETVTAAFNFVDSGLQDFLGQIGFFSTNWLQIFNRMHGGRVTIAGEDAAGAAVEFFNANPDGTIQVNSKQHVDVYPHNQTAEGFRFGVSGNVAYIRPRDNLGTGWDVASDLLYDTTAGRWQFDASLHFVNGPLTFGATATIAGILSTDLLDKAANEVVTGNWTFNVESIGDFTIDRQSLTGAAGIAFANDDGVKGYVGVDDNGTFAFWDSATVARLIVDSLGNLKADRGVTSIGAAVNTGLNEQIAFMDVNGGVGRFGSYNWSLAAWQPAQFQGSTVDITSTVGDISVGTTGFRVILPSASDVSLSSINHPFQIGLSSGANISMDSNEIMARNNGAVSDLFLNTDGGDVLIGNSGITSALFIQERAAPGTDRGGKGQFIVRSDVPNLPLFTGDTGVERVLGARHEYDYQFSTTQTMADPGAGFFRLNGATYGAAGQLAISATSRTGGNANALLDSVAVNDVLHVRDQSDPDKWVNYLVQSITDNITWFQLGIVRSPNVNGTVFLANNDAVAISRSQLNLSTPVEAGTVFGSALRWDTVETEWQETRYIDLTSGFGVTDSDTAPTRQFDIIVTSSSTTLQADALQSLIILDVPLAGGKVRIDGGGANDGGVLELSQHLNNVPTGLLDTGSLFAWTDNATTRPPILRYMQETTALQVAMLDMSSELQTWTGENTYTSQPAMRLGISGDYSQTGAATTWGATMWSIDSGFAGATAGNNSLNTSLYGLKWLRPSHTNARSDVGEGAYLFINGGLNAAIGANGLFTDGDVTAFGDVVLSTNSLVTWGGGLQMTYNGSDGVIGSTSAVDLVLETFNQTAIFCTQGAQVALYYAGVEAFRTMDAVGIGTHTAGDDNVSGAMVQWMNAATTRYLQPVGLMTMPRINKSTTTGITISPIHVHKQIYVTNVTNGITFNLDGTMPKNSCGWIKNDSGSPLTLTDGTALLKWFDGAGGLTGTRTLADGGWCTWEYFDDLTVDEFHLVGVGLS